MDGFRRGACRDLSELTRHIETLLGELREFEREELIRLHDKVAENQGILNCTYSDDDESWNDLDGEIIVRQLEVAD